MNKSSKGDKSPTLQSSMDKSIQTHSQKEKNPKHIFRKEKSFE